MFTGDEDVTQEDQYYNNRTPRRLSVRVKKQLKKNSLKRRKVTKNPFKVKLNSRTYSKKAEEIIKSADIKEPFFIYIALFTKSYPKQVKKTAIPGGIKDARNRDHAGKIAEMEDSIANIMFSARPEFPTTIVGAIDYVSISSYSYNASIVKFVFESGQSK